MYESLRAGAPVTLEHVGTFADGVAVRRVGDETFRLAQRGRRRGAAGQHRRDLRRDQGHLRGQPRASSSPPARSPSRDSSAYVEREPGRRRIADRDQQRREHELRPAAARGRARRDRRASRGADRGGDPGAAGRVSASSARPSARATSPSSTTATRPARRRASSSACRSARRCRKRPSCSPQLATRGYAVLDLSDNELAKLHVRHMVGGHVPGSRTSCSIASSSRSGRARCSRSSERSAIAGTSACSTTATTARTTAACSQASKCRRPSAPVREHLATLGYAYSEETANPAYRLFLERAGLSSVRVGRAANRNVLDGARNVMPSRPRRRDRAVDSRCARSSTFGTSDRTGAARPAPPRPSAPARSPEPAGDSICPRSGSRRR